MTRLLVRLPNWVGDAAMSLPAVAAIQRHWPTARVDLMAHPRVASLVSTFPGIGACLTVPVRGGAGWPELVRRLRREKYEAGILFPSSFSSALLFSLGGVRERIGRRGQGRDGLLSRSLPPGDRLRPQVSQYVDIVRALGYEGDDPPFDPVVNPAIQQVVSNWLMSRGIQPGKFLAMAPGAAYGPAKKWPPERFARVAADVHQARGWPTVLLGAPTEQELLGEVASHLESDVHRFDLPDLPEVVELLARAGALVSNDTGALHLGRLAGARVVGLFTSTSPEWTGPAPSEGEALVADVACRPCFRRHCPLATGRWACLSAIEPSSVVAAVGRQVDRTAVTA